MKITTNFALTICMLLYCHFCYSQTGEIKYQVFFPKKTEQAQKEERKSIGERTPDLATANEVMNLLQLANNSTVYQLQFHGNQSVGRTMLSSSFSDRIENANGYSNTTTTYFFIESNKKIKKGTEGNVSSEKLQLIDWEILTESKHIEGFLCHKAIATIDEQLIIAWFAKDIPCKFGPAHYWGLPGLILEITNQKGNSYKVTSYRREIVELNIPQEVLDEI